MLSVCLLHFAGQEPNSHCSKSRRYLSLSHEKENVDDGLLLVDKIIMWTDLGIGSNNNNNITDLTKYCRCIEKNNLISVVVFLFGLFSWLGLLWFFLLYFVTTESWSFQAFLLLLFLLLMFNTKFIYIFLGCCY